MIQLCNVKKQYPISSSDRVIALKDISISIQSGELVAIVGKSGAGKSTLLRILAGLEVCDNGCIILDNIDMNGLPLAQRRTTYRSKIGIVLQDFALIDDYTVMENVLLPIRFTNSIMGYRQKKSNAVDALKTVGIESLKKRKVATLSGGQKQRVAIARAIANSCDIILADEPTGALDTTTTKEIMNLFMELHSQGKTVIIVTHDPFVASCCPRVVEMRDGEIISDCNITATKRKEHEYA